MEVTTDAVVWIEIGLNTFCPVVTTDAVVWIEIGDGAERRSGR